MNQNQTHSRRHSEKPPLPTHLVAEGRLGERQGLGHADAHDPLGGPLEGLGGLVQGRLLQVDGVDEHEAVARDQTAVLLRHPARHQAADHDHRLVGVHGVLSQGGETPLAFSPTMRPCWGAKQLLPWKGHIRAKQNVFLPTTTKEGTFDSALKTYLFKQ